MFDNILSVPLWAVVVFLLVSILGTIALFLWAIFTEKPWQRVFIVPLNIVTASALVGLILWLTTACNGREIESTEDNEIFGSMVPEDSTVKRTVFKKTYCGIYFTDHRDWLQDTYTISKKEKK